MIKRLLAAFAMAATALLSAPAAGAYTIDISPTSPSNVSGLWWNASESGWGATLTQQGNIVFVTIFTYDDAGAPAWYVASNCLVSNDRCSGTLYRVTGGAPLTGTFNAGNVFAASAGALTIVFSDVNTALMSFTLNGVSSSKQITRQVFNAGAASNPNRDKSALLVGGTWTFTYAIISTFSDSYTFTTVSQTPDSDGDYFVSGTNPSGRPVGGFYVSKQNLWAVLYQGFTIDYFYTFTFSGNNFVTGCYYQISPSGSTNLSRCYSMTGTRSPPKAFVPPSDPDKLRWEVASDTTPGYVEPHALETYLKIKARIGE